MIGWGLMYFQMIEGYNDAFYLEIYGKVKRIKLSFLSSNLEALDVTSLALTVDIVIERTEQNVILLQVKRKKTLATKTKTKTVVIWSEIIFLKHPLKRIVMPCLTLAI